jgi:hypothetical protein
VSRRSWILWAAALLTAVAPSLYFWIEVLLSGNDGGRMYGWASFGQCEGYRLNDLIQAPQQVIEALFLFWHGGAPMIVLSFAGWYLSVRAGRHRLGRIVARCVATVLLLLPLPGLLLVAFDAALGPDCLAAWGPPDLIGWRVGMGLYELAPPILVLLAVRPPRRVFVRRGRVVRTALAILTVAATLLLPAKATPPGKVSSERELDCAGFGDGTVKGLTRREKDFLCQVRGYDSFHGEGGVEGWEKAPDRVVLRQGHHLCGLITRHGGDLNARAVREAPHASLAHSLAPLCPAVSRWQEAEGKKEQDEEAAFYAKGERACAAHPAHRPKIKPVWQRRATLWTESWTIHGFEDEYVGDDPELVEDLVGSDPGALAIWAADEFGHACVTAESYTKRPPLETKGWDEVVEVGYESPKGALALSGYNGANLTGLTRGGPGSYRVRVHLRGRKLVYQVPYPPDGAVELLVMVFPGEGKRVTVYK